MTFGTVLDWLLQFVSSRAIEFAILLTAIALELAVRSRPARRLVAKGYFVDLTYAAFYRLGVYALLMGRPIQDFVYAHLTWQPLRESPTWIRTAIYLLVLDFTQYWVHRLQHAVPALWAVHQVHHSQDQLTIMTTYRLHPVDMWMRSFFGPVIFMALFGVPPAIWLPITLVWEAIINLSHLEVRWTYGPVRWLLVSPVSHSIHHSVEDRHQSKNLAMVLSVWDYLFGTADRGLERPRAVGLPGWRVPDSLIAHLWVPIRDIVRHYRRQPPGNLAPLSRQAAEAPAGVGGAKPPH